MIELVPMAYRITREVDLSNPQPANNNVNAKEGNSNGSTNGGAGSVSREGGRTEGTTGEEQEQEERDAVFYRLEMLGYRVGQGLVER